MTTTAQKPKKNGQVPPSPPSPAAEAQPQKGRKPDLYAYATVPNGRSTRIGSRIGVAFNHKAGEGLTIFLDAQPFPMDGQVEIVCYPPRPQP